jgi:hypothetical protein
MPDVDEREARNPFSGPRADLGRRAQTTDTIIIGVAVIAGQGLDLLEIRGWDDAALGVIKV